MNDDQELIDSYLDGELTADEEKRLADWLSADRENMRAFVRGIHLHRQLRSIMLAHPFQAGADAVVKKTERTTLLSSIASTVLTLRRSWLPIAGCLALLIGAGVWFFGPSMGEPSLVEVQGSGLSIMRASQPLSAVVGMRLQTADVLRTPSNGTAVISFAPEATRVTLQPGTELKLAGMSRSKRFDLRLGKLEASVARQRPFQPMVLTTPQAQARVIGTRFTLTVKTNSTRLDVTQGNVRLTRLSDERFVQVLAGHYAVAADNYELAALPFTGSILREYWTNVPGGFFATYLTSSTNYPDHPSGRDYLSRFETSSNWGTNYGARIRGYLLPPATGDYTFWIAAGDGGDLFLSPDDNQDHRQEIAHWEPKGNARQSTPLPLKAGCKYYLEVLQKTGKADSHLTVEWQGPGRNREVISGEFLSPWKPKWREKQHEK